MTFRRAVEADAGGKAARRIRQRCNAVSMLAVALVIAASDPFATVKQALASIRPGRQPAAATLAKAGDVLAADASRRGMPDIKASRQCPHRWQEWGATIPLPARW